MSKVARGTYFEFGRFRLYPTERVLECDGDEVRLARQRLDILHILLKCRDRKVPNKELIEAIWPGIKSAAKAAAAAGNLHVEIAGLRKALKEASRSEEPGKDSGDAMEAIKNFRGEGYKFVADVYEQGARTVVAIQPWTREGSPSKPDAVGQGMADKVATMLNKHTGIHVMPSVTTIREDNEHSGLKPLAFGHRLGADHVFGGVIGRGQVKVSHTDVRAGEEVGSTIISSDDPESFETCLLILKWIKTELKLAPTAREAEQSTKQYTTNKKANALYQKGRIQRFRGTEVSLRRATNYFKRAVAEDPRFARAYANLADTYIFMGAMNLITPRESYEGSRDAAIAARDLDPAMASAHAAWAFTKFFYERRWDEAREGFEEAIAINPNYPTARMGHAHYLISQGNRIKAQREIDEAMALNPYSFFISFVRGMVYFLSRTYDESLKRFEWTHELNLRFNIKSDLSHYGLSLAHEYIGHSCDAPDEREEEFKHADHEAHLAIVASGGHPLKLLHRAHVYAMWGKMEEAMKLFDRVLRMREEGHYVSPYHMATVYAAVGEDDQAIDSLKEAEHVRDQYLFLTGVDPRLDSLRPDPRFKELLSRLRLKV